MNVRKVLSQIILQSAQANLCRHFPSRQYFCMGQRLSLNYYSIKSESINFRTCIKPHCPRDRLVYLQFISMKTSIDIPLLSIVYICTLCTFHSCPLFYYLCSFSIANKLVKMTSVYLNTNSITISLYFFYIIQKNSITKGKMLQPKKLQCLSPQMISGSGRCQLRRNHRLHLNCMVFQY